MQNAIEDTSESLRVLSVSEDYRVIAIVYDEMEFTFHISRDGKTMTRNAYINYGTYIYIEPPWFVENQCKQRAWIIFRENEKREKELTPQKIEENFKECMQFFNEKKEEAQLQFHFSKVS